MWRLGWYIRAMERITALIYGINGFVTFSSDKTNSSGRLLSLPEAALHPATIHL
jgi:hypothetical protein